MSEKLSRRSFLRLSALAAAGVTVVACAKTATQAPPEPTATTKAEAAATDTPVPAGPSANQAPILQEEVSAGSLPEVEERMPSEPLLVTPYDQIGTYGGAWRSGLKGTADTYWMSRTIGHEPLVRWNVEWTELSPDMAEYEVAAEGKEWIWRLRPGMRWSDGEPATADDIVFWYEDVVSNDDLTSVKPSWFQTAGEMGKIEKVDDFTFKMVFTEPNGLLLQWMAMHSGSVFWPQAKYAKQFHLAYNKEAVEKGTADGGFDTWMAYYWRQVDRWNMHDVPTLYGWIVTTAVGEGTQVVADRNPYYRKIDPEGKQLPYLDQVVYPIVENAEILVMKAINGEIEMMDRHIGTLDNKPVFVDNKEKGNYDFFTTRNNSNNTCHVQLNFTHKDPVQAEIHQNKQFRIALSHAMNRQEIIDLVYQGQGEPWQFAPVKASPFYHDKMPYQYLEYDPDKANQLLDEIGLTEKNADGIRLRSDGQPLTINFEIRGTWPAGVNELEMCKNYWKAIGVNITIKEVERGLFSERMEAGEHDATIMAGSTSMAPLVGPWFYFPYGAYNCFAPLWARWRETGGKGGEEPPEAPKKQMEIYEEIKVTTDSEQQIALFLQILDIATEQFYLPGTSTPIDGYGIVKNNFKNVPKVMWSSGQEYMNPGVTHPEQYFLEA